MAADPIPAVREADATGDIADIFADLRATLRVPFVNLVWRHLATIPGGLAATWTLLKPVYLAPRLDHHATLLRTGVQLPSDLGLPSFVWDSAGVDHGARFEITTLLQDYNRANSVNLLALTLACSVYRQQPLSPRERSPVARRPAPQPGLVQEVRPLIALADLPASVRTLVEELDQFGRAGQVATTASLYRHLGHWPSFLALAYAALVPHHRSGILRREGERLVATASGVSAEMLSCVGQPPTNFGPVERDSVITVLDEFTRLMIGRMIVLGAALLALVEQVEG
jgi:hypothetical protein